VKNKVVSQLGHKSKQDDLSCGTATLRVPLSTCTGGC